MKALVSIKVPRTCLLEEEGGCSVYCRRRTAHSLCRCLRPRARMHGEYSMASFFLVLFSLSWSSSSKLQEPIFASITISAFDCTCFVILFSGAGLVCPKWRTALPAGWPIYMGSNRQQCCTVTSSPATCSATRLTRY